MQNILKAYCRGTEVHRLTKGDFQAWEISRSRQFPYQIITEDLKCFSTFQCLFQSETVKTA